MYWKQTDAPLPGPLGDPFVADNSDRIPALELFANGKATGLFFFPNLWPYDDAPCGFALNVDGKSEWFMFGYHEESAEMKAREARGEDRSLPDETIDSIHAKAIVDGKEAHVAAFKAILLDVYLGGNQIYSGVTLASVWADAESEQTSEALSRLINGKTRSEEYVDSGGNKWRFDRL